MATRVAKKIEGINDATADSLQQLVRALHDSTSYLKDAADQIEGDELVSTTLRHISQERKAIGEKISEYLSRTDHPPVEEGSFLGNLRAIWTSLRASLNAGDATVVLIEAERAEDAIVRRFKEILPEIAGNPVNDRLNEFFESVKRGHDQIRSLRDAYQAR